MTSAGGGSDPSAWIVRFAPLVPAGATVLDLACGAGRHARLFLERGHPVSAVDIDVSGLDDLRGHPQLEIVQADLENAPWPLPGRRFGAVIVTNYLWRPLFEPVLEAIEAGGLLLYETFARGNEAYGRPTNPEFLLQPGRVDRGGARSPADRGLRARLRRPPAAGGQAAPVRGPHRAAAAALAHVVGSRRLAHRKIGTGGRPASPGRCLWSTVNGSRRRTLEPERPRRQPA